MKSCTFAVLALFFLVARASAAPAAGAGHEGNDHPAAETPAPHAQHASEAEPAAAVAETAPDPVTVLNEENASLMRIGAKKLEAKDGASALIAYRQVAAEPLDDNESALALLGMARAYRMSGEGVKAVATYEHLILKLPNSKEVPIALLELGRALRDLGSTRLALARFYSVINSTLKLPEGESDRYKSVVRTAQFEIAETHMGAGSYAEAAKFFSRLDLLDLAPEDRSRARFKAAQAKALSSDDLKASVVMAAFIEENPDDINSPEARFMLANLYYKTGRLNESLQVTLHLLHHEKARGDPTGTWRSWQRRTGNLLANQFYEQGEFFSALQLYRALDAMGETAEWRVPVLYQLALCQERLRQNEEALVTYAEIKKLAGDKPSIALADILRMADWRIGQIQWMTTTRVAVDALQANPSESESPLMP
jgi:TolA-binding protein